MAQLLSHDPVRTGAGAPAPLLDGVLARRRWTWLAVGAVAALAAAGLWLGFGRTPAQTGYVTVALDKGRVERAVTASGTVNPILTVLVGSYVSGVIQDISCDFNTSVRRGQVCATIDPRPYETAVAQDRAALETAKAQLGKDQAALAYQSLNYQRQQNLLALDSTSRDAVDAARSLRDQTQAQVAFDQATIRQRQAELRAGEINLGYTRITSPVDGTVVSRNVTVGQTVAASFQTPTLFLIAQDLTRMQVDANISESDIEGEGHALKAGDPADFTVEALPRHVFHGRVAQVRQAPQTVQNVVTYDVVINVDNRELLLRPGMTATVHVVSAERDGVLRVPNTALRFTPGGLGARATPNAHPTHQVWVMRDGRPAPVTVDLGLQDDSFTEIIGGGLTAGDRVVTAQAVGAARKAGRSGAPAPRF